MPTESGPWGCCRLGCPSIPLGSQERTGNSGVISSRGPGLRETVGREGNRLGRWRELQSGRPKVQVLLRVVPSTYCV